MDTVINRLSEIEAAAGAIVEEANARKKAFAEEMDAKTAAFDKSMEQETARRMQRSGEDGGGHERAPCKAEGGNQRPCLRSWKIIITGTMKNMQRLFQKMIKG